eukprot:1161703-Pelagomonas_calceolata.AAC.2
MTSTLSLKQALVAADSFHGSILKTYAGGNSEEYNANVLLGLHMGLYEQKNLGASVHTPRTLLFISMTGSLKTTSSPENVQRLPALHLSKSAQSRNLMSDTY